MGGNDSKSGQESTQITNLLDFSNHFFYSLPMSEQLKQHLRAQPFKAQESSLALLLQRLKELSSESKDIFKHAPLASANLSKFLAQFNSSSCFIKFTEAEQNNLSSLFLYCLAKPQIEFLQAFTHAQTLKLNLGKTLLKEAKTFIQQHRNSNRIQPILQFRRYQIEPLTQPTFSLLKFLLYLSTLLQTLASAACVLVSQSAMTIGQQMETYTLLWAAYTNIILGLRAFQPLLDEFSLLADQVENAERPKMRVEILGAKLWGAQFKCWIQGFFQQHFSAYLLRCRINKGQSHFFGAAFSAILDLAYNENIAGWIGYSKLNYNSNVHQLTSLIQQSTAGYWRQKDNDFSSEIIKLVIEDVTNLQFILPSWMLNQIVRVSHQQYFRQYLLDQLEPLNEESIESVLKIVQERLERGKREGFDQNYLDMRKGCFNPSEILSEISGELSLKKQLGSQELGTSKTAGSQFISQQKMFSILSSGCAHKNKQESEEKSQRKYSQESFTEGEVIEIQHETLVEEILEFIRFTIETQVMITDADERIKQCNDGKSVPVEAEQNDFADFFKQENVDRVGYQPYKSYAEKKITESYLCESFY